MQRIHCFNPIVRRFGLAEGVRAKFLPLHLSLPCCVFLIFINMLGWSSQQKGRKGGIRYFAASKKVSKKNVI